MFHVLVYANFAETWRDPDDYQIVKNFGYFESFEDSKAVAEKFISKWFLHTETPLTEREDGTWRATDFCSFGRTVVLQSVVEGETFLDPHQLNA